MKKRELTRSLATGPSAAISQPATETRLYFEAYDELDANLREQLQAGAVRIHSLNKQEGMVYFAKCDKLAELRQLPGVEGHWERWCEEELGYTPRHVRTMIAAAAIPHEYRPALASQLPTVIGLLTNSTLPEDAVRALVAAAGERILRVADAKQIVDAHKPEPESKEIESPLEAAIRQAKEAPPADTGEADGDGPSPLSLDEMIALIWRAIKAGSSYKAADTELLEKLRGIGRPHQLTPFMRNQHRVLDASILFNARAHILNELSERVLHAQRKAERRTQHEQQQRDQAAATSSYVAPVVNTGNPAEAGHAQTIVYTASDEQPEMPSEYAARLINDYPMDEILISFGRSELLSLLDDFWIVEKVIDALGNA